MSLPDIKNHQTLHRIVTDFYQKVFDDAIIGYIFTDVAKLNLQEHIPIVVNFWHDVLFNTQLHQTNVMAKHMDLNEKITLKKGHFVRWLFLFDSTVDSLAQGDNAQKMKHRAHSIAQTMRAKLHQQPREQKGLRLDGKRR